MKVFISWSGDLSKAIAEAIKKWLPCIIQSADVFFSSNDIEKGENWDTKISKELLDSSYGIVCLTKENVSAPWIHFEAGALAKTLDSKVATLMINISPTDIKGPLSRYQATKLEKNDFYQLIENINSKSETPISSETIQTLFDNLWETINNDFSKLINQHQKATSSKKKNINNNEALEEILLLLRKQNSILSSPETLFPIEYYQKAINTINSGKSSAQYNQLTNEILDYIGMVLNECENNFELLKQLLNVQFDNFIENLEFYINKRYRHTYNKYRDVSAHFIHLKNTYYITIDNNMFDK